MAETGGDKKPAVPDLEDRISALPDGVLEYILGFLPADQLARPTLAPPVESVKHLSITCCDFENPQRTHISAPSLLSLQLCYSFGYAPLLEKIPSLESAVFNSPADFYAHEGWESCDACRKCWCDTDPIVDDILGEANDLYSLVRILERSPILEKLTLQLSGGYKWTGESEGRYRPSDQLPAISELLDMVEIKCRKIDERVSYIMEFLGGFIKHINVNLDSKPSTGSRQAPGSAAGWSMDGLYLDS
ncbi:hypothetical protein EJB05_36957, partial [Eragrostis curvula]